MSELDGSRLQDWIERYEAAHFLMTKRMHVIVRDQLEGGLTIEQFSILRYIRRHGSVTSTELAEAFCVGKSAITSIMTRLVDKALIDRVQDAGDRRVVYLALTEEGKRLERIFAEKVQANVGKYLKQFESDEVERFLVCFERLGKLMASDSDEGGR